MRDISLSSGLLACLVLAACGPAPSPGAPAAPPPTVTVAPPPVATAAEPEPEPAEADLTAALFPPPAPPPLPPPDPDIADSPGDGRLDAAAALIRAGKHREARLALTKVLPEIEKTGTLDVKMAAHALLARACSSLGDSKCAADEHRVVRDAWKDPTAAVARLDAAGGSDAAKQERLRRALNAAGEALFFVAEEKRRAAEKEKFPVYTGRGDSASVHKHVNTKVVDWVKKRRSLIEEAERAYLAVASLEPIPPPRWSLASAASVGTMWSSFVAQFRAAPIPNDWQGSGLIPGTNVKREEVRQNYYEALDEASSPQRATARAAFEKCQSLARRFAIQDERSKTCDTWLANNPAPAPAP